MGKDLKRNNLMDSQFPYGSIKSSSISDLFASFNSNADNASSHGVNVEIESERNEFNPSSSRFVVAFLICLSSALNCFIQYTFVSIWKIAIEAYDVDALAVNMLALVFAVFYIPGSVLAINLYARYGLNSCIIGAAFLNLLACLVRYSSFLTSTPSIGFTTVLIGHIIAAIGSPLVLNAPSRVANDWFPKKERAIAVSIMTQSNYIGGGLGGLLPALQVSGTADILRMLLSQAVVAGIILFLSIVLTPNHSPVHADFDAAYQVELRSHIDVTNVSDICKQMLRDFSVMLTNFNFVMLLISFALQVGLSWALGSVIGQILQPCGYTDELVGKALLITTVAGTIGSFISAYVLYYCHRSYFYIYKIMVLLTSIGCLLVFRVNQPGGPFLVLFCWMLYGVTCGPLTPVSLELAAEMTYPIPADNSATLLFTMAVSVYFACAVVLTPLLRLQESSTCSAFLSPAALSACAISLIAILTALPMKPLFNRKEMSDKELAIRKIPSVLM